MAPPPRRAGLLGLVMLAAACSGAEAPRPHAPTVSGAGAATVKAAVPYPTPAHWEVYPSPRSSFAVASMRLADGRCLVVEPGGERWLTVPRRGAADTAGMSEEEPPLEDGEDDEPEGDFASEPSARCEEAPRARRAAVERAPEPLVGVVRWASSFAFVGASGTLHEARSPLGRFVRRISPPEPLIRVRGVGNTLLAVTATGRLLRWDQEGGYQRVDLGGVHAFDLAVAPTGHAVVLGAPEAVFTSEDGGRRFTRTAAPPVGARRVAHPPGGPFIVEGIASSLTWDPRHPLAFTKGRARSVEDDTPIPPQVGSFPEAALVAQGRAALDGDQYWELGVGDEGEWILRKAKLGRALTRLPVVAGTAEHDNAVLAVRGRHVAVVQIGWDGDRTVVKARISHDGAASFEEPIPLVMSELSPLGVALSPEGVALFTGLCLPDDVDGADECAGGPLVARIGAPPAAPRGARPEGPALTPAFSQDGRSAYFLGPRAKDSHIALYVSHDAGASFEERALDRNGGESSFRLQTETAVTVSENGAVGMVLEAVERGGATMYVTTNADGRDIRANELPTDVEIVGGFGDRVLAVARRSDAGDPEPHIRESLDGGVTWTPVHGPALLEEGYRRRGDVACGAAGCLVGDEVVRIGWGGRSEAPLPFEKVEAVPPPADLRTPIVCEPRPGSTWTRIEHVSDAHRFPDESDAARGRTAWTLPTFDPQTGAVGVVTAPLPQNGESDAPIVPRQLLGPTPKGKLFALAIRPQIEGLAVARVEIDPAAAKVGPAAWTRRRLEDLEVAWDNLEEGSSTRAVLPDAGSLRPYSIFGTAKDGFTLVLDMLSVSPKGLFVRGSGEDRSAHFVDTAGKVKAFRYPESPLELLDGALLDAGDAVHVDGAFLPSSQLGGDRPEDPEITVLFRPPAPSAAPTEPWVTWAMTLAPGGDPRKNRFTRSDWTYDRGHLAVWALHVVPDAAYATAWMSPVQANGTLAAPVRLPTPHDLPRTPRPCTAAEHRDLPRVRMPLELRGRAMFPGTRHPVLVTEIAPPAPSPAADPRLASRAPPPKPAVIGRASLLATGYVLRGPPSSPCLDAIAARGTDDPLTATLLMGDLQQGWYFRVAPRKRPPPALAPSPRVADLGTSGSLHLGNDDGETPAGLAASHDIEVRPLTCRFDPGATVPTSVLEANARR